MATFRNPLTIASLVLAVVGLALSAYLSYVHYNLDALVCGTGSCELVQTSEYSEMFGIPIAIFGVVMFIVVIAGIILRELRPETADLVSTGILVILLTAILYWIPRNQRYPRHLPVVCRQQPDNPRAFHR